MADDALVLTIPRTKDAPREARESVRGIAGPRSEDATLLVSELVTNAVMHGAGGPMTLFVDRDDEKVRFTVSDAGGGPLPVMREAADAGADGGHGLRIVDALADRWGVERGSTRVWFELYLDRPCPTPTE
jgi:anti-sigma regulatory factor (Ser/Thr protein kinase)